MAKKALLGVKKLAQDKYGVELKFNTTVSKVDRNSVTTTSGVTFNANHVVVAAGAYSAELFDDNPTAKRLEVEYYSFKDTSGLPAGIIELSDSGMEYYGVLDGPNLDHFKIGDYSQRNFKNMLDYFKRRMPSKLDSICHTHPCYFTMVDTGEFQYKTGNNGVHYAYGFNGTGFKFMPLHGKIVYDGLIKKTDEKYIPLRFRAKL